MEKCVVLFAVCWIGLFQGIWADTGKRCSYHPTYMQTHESGKIWVHGRQYTLQCEDRKRTFLATCRDGAWVFEKNYCQGPVGGYTAPVNQPHGQVSAGKGCSYNPTYMQTYESGKVWVHGRQYTLQCEDRKRSFLATCINGAWVFEKDFCQGPVGYAAPVAQPQQQVYAGKGCSYHPTYMQTRESGRKWLHGQQYTLQCEDRKRSFLAMCRDGAWVFAKNYCQEPVVLPNQHVYANPQPAVPAPYVPKPEGCKYLPGYMRTSDMERVWPDGQEYGMRCEDRRRYFMATCVKHAWVFEQNYCQGPVRQGMTSSIFGPIQKGRERPAPQRPYENPDVKPIKPVGYEGGDNRISTGMPLLDNLVDRLQHMFSPFTSPSDDAKIENLETDIYGSLDNAFGSIFNFPSNENTAYKNCPYDPTHIRPEDGGKIFSHGYNYRSMCKGYGERYYYGTCKDGEWHFKEYTCKQEPRRGIFSTNYHGEEIFGDLGGMFGNLFNFGPTKNPADYNQCAYDQTHIKAEHSGKTFGHGYQYKATCKDYPDRYYYLMCNDGQWVYDENTCKTPGYHGSSFFDNLSYSLRNLFGSSTGSQQQKREYRSCPYNPAHIRPEDSGRTFTHGYRYSATCKNYPDRHYHGSCYDGQWRFNDRQCSSDQQQQHSSGGDGGSFLDNLASGFQTLLKPLAKPPNLPDFKMGEYKRCYYDPTRLRPEDTEKTFYHGYRYRAVCTDYPDRYYAMMCNDGKWIYDEQTCSSPTRPRDGLSSIFDNLSKGLQNIFRPITNPGVPRGDYRSCSYDPTRLRPEDNGKTFYHGFRYRAVCRGYPDRYYAAMCNDGQWIFDEQTCSSPTGPLNGLSSIFDNLSRSLRNIFRPITNPRVPRRENYKGCTYDSAHMIPQDDGLTFYHGYRYRSECKNYPGRFYTGSCLDGQWKFEDRVCTTSYS